MRWLAAAVAISVAAFSAPAQASDDLSSSAAGPAPLDDAMLAMTTGGAAAALQLAAATEAGAQSVDLPRPALCRRRSPIPRPALLAP